MTEARWHEYFGTVSAPFACVGGSLHVLPALYSPQLRNRRDLFVYLPPGYHRSANDYPVLYLHDGQNLFDPAISFAGEWGVDDAIVATGCEAIVVAIPNIDSVRLTEYSPFPDWECGGGRGEVYVDFLVETVKPIIDRAFRTRRDAVSTVIGGASMGGLISLYAQRARPDVFGCAAVMSPSLWFGREPLFAWLADQGRRPGRVYLDIGTLEGDEMLEDARRLHALMVRQGYRASVDLQYREQVAAHCEAAWAARFRSALPFLVNDRRGSAQARLGAIVRATED